jgi:hypothetical protein
MNNSIFFRFLDAHLLSKGLDPLNIEIFEKDENSSSLDNDGMNILL